MSQVLQRLTGHEKLLVRRKVLTMLGAKFHVYDELGELLFYTKLKAFKLKEDIRLYGSEAMEEELLRIKARQVIDFAAAYDVEDATTGEKLGALRRKGFKSILRDEWLILDAEDQEIGKVIEDSGGLAFLRRFVDFVSLLIPQGYNMNLAGQTVATMKQNYNPFVMKITLDFSPDQDDLLDRRVGLAAAILLCAIEGKQ